jgi:hypothetical protein
MTAVEEQDLSAAGGEVKRNTRSSASAARTEGWLSGGTKNSRKPPAPAPSRVELFFFFMVVHLWGKYWMSAWRGGRARVWMSGAIAFLIAVPCALTGYVSQQNFDAQWISTQAKDAMNAAGIGAFFNLLNFGQMYSYHVLLLPAAVVGIVVAHILLVRKHGVVPPFKLPVTAPKGVDGSAPAEPGASS